MAPASGSCRWMAVCSGQKAILGNVNQAVSKHCLRDRKSFHNLERRQSIHFSYCFIHSSSRSMFFFCRNCRSYLVAIHDVLLFCLQVNIKWINHGELNCDWHGHCNLVTVSDSWDKILKNNWGSIFTQLRLAIPSSITCTRFIWYVFKMCLLHRETPLIPSNNPFVKASKIYIFTWQTLPCHIAGNLLLYCAVLILKDLLAEP